MNHISIDIETLDTLPTAAITQIGVCSFDKEEIKSTLNIHLDCATQHHGTASKATLDWIKSKNLPRWEGPTFNYKEACTILNHFLLNENFSTIWCYGASFDFPILRIAYHHAKIDMPWHYRQERCLRTALAMKNITLTNNSHDALEDAINQAKLMIKAKLI